MRQNLLTMSCVAAAISIAQPAWALILLEDSAERIVVTPVWDYNDDFEPLDPTCWTSEFVYVQLMIVDGVPTMVPTEFVYVGRKDLEIFATCDGSYIYGLGDCAC